MDLFIKFQSKGTPLKLEKERFRINGENHFFFSFLNTVGDKLTELILPTLTIH